MVSLGAGDPAVRAGWLRTAAEVPDHPAEAGEMPREAAFTATLVYCEGGYGRVIPLSGPFVYPPYIPRRGFGGAKGGFMWVLPDEGVETGLQRDAEKVLTYANPARAPGLARQ